MSNSGHLLVDDDDNDDANLTLLCDNGMKVSLYRFYMYRGVHMFT